MTRVAALLCAVATPAVADSSRVWENLYAADADSSVTIHEPTEPGAVATVTFVNTPVHGMDEQFSIAHDGIKVSVHFEWNADGTDSERMTVYPPDGYIAIPETITVPEDQTMALHIYQWLGG